MIEQLREKAHALPLKPGVYIMMDKARDVIYVGKAKALKNRVSSYFHGGHTYKTQVMVSKIDDFDVIIANSEFEAFVLENSLIKHHMPKYNILLRDDKGYPFIRVDLSCAYPTFTIVSKITEDGAKYLGPFGGRSVTRESIETVKKALKLPACSKKFPRDIGKERPCLNHHMNACLAFCQNDSLHTLYCELINAAIDILCGKSAQLISKLEAEMNDAAENLQFELAAEKRDRMRAVTLLENRQLVISGARADTDIVGFYKGDVKSCFTVLHYTDGKLTDKDFEILDIPLEDENVVSGIVRQYYEKRGVLPKRIYLPVQEPDTELLERLFSELSGRRVYIEIPRRGDKLKLVETANINAREETERAVTREERTLKTLEWLQRALNIEKSPERMEAYDISNTGASGIVASMTVFVRGKPLKRDYRRFKIKTLTQPDDYTSMREAVSRRIERYLSGDDKFGVLPDVMLIDGGVTHARAVESELCARGVFVPVFGMVKDDRHRTRALVAPDGREIGINANPAVFKLIGTIQEETHRFAIEYHRTVRSSEAFKSVLDEIPGVGKKRRDALYKVFRSVGAIRAAAVEELAEVVPRRVAETIFAHFNAKDGE